MIDDCTPLLFSHPLDIKLIGADNTESDSESDFNKLFTTHKFQVIEDLSQSYPIPSVKQPSVSKVSQISF